MQCICTPREEADARVRINEQEAYGIPCSPLQTWLAETVGFLSVSFALVAYKVSEGTSLASAFGYSAVMWSIACLKTILNDVPANVGAGVEGQYFGLLLHAGCVYASFYQPESTALSVYKAISGFWALNGVNMFVNPSGAAKLWKCPPLGDVDEMMFKSVGASLMATSVLMLALLQGEGVTKAVGYGLIPLLVLVLDGLFGSGFVSKLGLSTNMVAVNGAVMAGVIACSLF